MQTPIGSHLGALCVRTQHNQSGVLALKVPFTSRAETLQLREQLRHLEDYIPTVPGVGNTFDSTRFVVAEMKTPNVISMTRSR